MFIFFIQNRKLIQFEITIRNQKKIREGMKCFSLTIKSNLPQSLKSNVYYTFVLPKVL